MRKAPKINQYYYVILQNADGSVDIARGRACGCYECPTAWAPYKYILETPLGYVERYQSDMYDDLNELTEDLKKCVIE